MKDLFGNDVMQIGDKPKDERTAIFQHKQLIEIYGITEGKKCKECSNCQQHQGGSKRFYKCHLAKISHSQATDWNSRWQACGKFDPLQNL